MFVVVAALMAAKCVSLDGGRAAGSGETTQMWRSNTRQQRNYMGVTRRKKKNSVQIEVKSQTEAGVCMPHSVHFHAATPPSAHSSPEGGAKNTLQGGAFT